MDQQDLHYSTKAEQAELLQKVSFFIAFSNFNLKTMYHPLSIPKNSIINHNELSYRDSELMKYYYYQS